MAEELELPVGLKRAGWKVKIQDKEKLEPPHVSILNGTDKWRVDLRTWKFMDRKPLRSNVPKELMDFLRDNCGWACGAWDKMYPDNPVQNIED